jgi:hypothetical protein
VDTPQIIAITSPRVGWHTLAFDAERETTYGITMLDLEA